MPVSLNIQSERSIRYEQRCLRQLYTQQKKDRQLRFENRNNQRDISNEVASYISNMNVSQGRMNTRSMNANSSI